MHRSTTSEVIHALEYPVSPPSPSRQPVSRSSLRISTIINNPSQFEQVLSPKSSTSSRPSPEFSKPPPSRPPQWLWRCHLCGSAYSLGTTRRCLNDGHYFCAGTSVNRRTGRRKQHAACGSTFDYIGWQAYGDWRRREIRLRAISEAKIAAVTPTRNLFSAYLSDLINFKRGQDTKAEHKHEDSSNFSDTDMTDATSLSSPQSPERSSHCERQCNYPSECRWGKKMSPIKEKKKRRVKKPESNFISLEAKKTPTGDIQLEPVKDTSKPKIVEDQDTSTTEFHLDSSSLKRNPNYSLPSFASYSWLNMVPGSVVGPPSPPLSEVFNPMDIQSPQDRPRKDSWPLRSFRFPHLQKSIEELDQKMSQDSNSSCRTTFRHKLFTPEATPEPGPQIELRSAAEIEEPAVSPGTDSSSNSSRLPSPAFIQSQPMTNWNWDVGGLPHAWDSRSYGMAGEPL